MQASKLENGLIFQADARADGGEREVEINRSGIIIARRLSGARMRVRVEAKSYRGVVLTLLPTPAGGDAFRLSLWHTDRDLNVTLAVASDDRDIVAIWKSWAAYFGLPKFIEREPGRLEGAERRMGEVALGGSLSPRRRGSAMTARRSRRRLLRKMGAPALLVQDGWSPEAAAH